MQRKQFLVSLIALGAVAAGSVQAATVTVVFKSATLPSNAAAVIAKAGGTMVSAVPQIGVAIASGPASMLDKLNGDTRVQAASPELTFNLPNERSIVFTPSAVDIDKATYYNLYQWDIKQVTNEGASWKISSGSHNTVVGIIDTGVSTQHPALKANLLGGRNFVPDGPGGTVVPTDIEDRNGHGSHVAGNIAGNGRILGIGPDLGFRSYRIFGATGGAPTDRIIQAMVAAVNDKVDVISMSLGGFDCMSMYSWTDPETGTVYRGKDVADFLAERRAVQYAVAKGVTVVAAAGNDATNIANPSSVTAMLNEEYGSKGYVFIGASRAVPGTLAGVVSVSATAPDKKLASYSNYGPGAIDVTAPGGDNLRYPATGWYTDMCLSAYKGTSYVWMDGTSMATPKASAVAALIIDQAKGKGIRLLPSQVVTSLEQTAVSLNNPALFGAGMVNAVNALSQH